MKTYRNIEYRILDNHVEFYHELSKRRIGGDIYKNGKKYISIPDGFKKCPDFYARKMIDRTYNWAKYHKDFEERNLLKKHLDVYRQSDTLT